MTALPVPHLDTLGSVTPGLLYPHQADGVAFLISKKRAILADDMGLGKTRQASPASAKHSSARTQVVAIYIPAWVPRE